MLLENLNTCTKFSHITHVVRKYEPLHWKGTDWELQSRGSVIASALLIGRLNGTLPVTIRHMQSVLLVMSEPRASQQPEVGEPPPFVLPVMKFRHGVKLLMRELLHAVVIWADAMYFIDIARAMIAMRTALLWDLIFSISILLDFEFEWCGQSELGRVFVVESGLGVGHGGEPTCYLWSYENCVQVWYAGVVNCDALHHWSTT